MTAAWHLQLHKDRRTRAEEERLAGRLVLNVVAEACQRCRSGSISICWKASKSRSRAPQAPPAWQDLLLGKVESVCVGPISPLPLGEGQGVRASDTSANANCKMQIANCKLSPSNPQSLIPNPPSARLLFPGAFNPLHAGHRRMMEIAQEMLRQPAALEISIENVDKPPLDYMEIERRLGQFPPEQTVYLTRAATFEEKSRLFAGATFIVGVDTLRRIAAPQYYGDNVSACECAIQRIADRGCRFLVFGRDLGAGFVRLGDVDLPERSAPSAAKSRRKSSAKTFLPRRCGNRACGKRLVGCVLARTRFSP